MNDQDMILIGRRDDTERDFFIFYELYELLKILNDFFKSR